MGDMAIMDSQTSRLSGLSSFMSNCERKEGKGKKHMICHNVNPVASRYLKGMINGEGHESIALTVSLYGGGSGTGNGETDK